MTQSDDRRPSLGPISVLPSYAEDIKSWRILFLVSSFNSFSQRVWVYFNHLGFKHISVQVVVADRAGETGGHDDAVWAVELFEPDIVLCPFLMAKVPEEIYEKYLTLVVHPGPPGDAGPSALDWVLLGDGGEEPSSSAALKLLQDPKRSLTPRTHWASIVFRATDEMDKGEVWAWEQYELPPAGGITKAQLYQGPHASAATQALLTALLRVHECAAGRGAPPVDGILRLNELHPQTDWPDLSVSHQSLFLGGPTHVRDLLRPADRKINLKTTTGQDIIRWVNASDSQPGAQLIPITSDSKATVFIYGVHRHSHAATIPIQLYETRGWTAFDDVPAGTALATRDGAVLFKVVKPQDSEQPVAIWLTHGRVIKPLGTPIEPKIPLAQALREAGHGSVLAGVQEWNQDSFERIDHTWQQVYVDSIEVDGKLAQRVHWDFYNGAFTTENCRLLLRALQWAVEPERGNVKALVLMGGHYFSNGIALNIIEHQSPTAGDSRMAGEETWANINAIDDIVEFLLGDTHTERSPFMQDVKPLCERGIVTIAALRGNAAAGGVALAAACDVVLAARSVVLNPAYRAMGLHGSEFHSFSYRARCGAANAAAILRDMTPHISSSAREIGLVDVELGSYNSSREDLTLEMDDHVRQLLCATMETIPTLACAPWCSQNTFAAPETPVIELMTRNKIAFYASRLATIFPPLVHFRNEELSQMLLDCFHPIRSERYHRRRRAFIRKVKSRHTPARYACHLREQGQVDEEEGAKFDDAPDHMRGEEWAWVGLPVPASLETSEWTRINLYAERQELVTPAKTKAHDRESISMSVRLSADSSSTSIMSVGITTPLSPLSMGREMMRDAPYETPSKTQGVKPDDKSPLALCREDSKDKTGRHQAPTPSNSMKGPSDKRQRAMNPFRTDGGELAEASGTIFPCLFDAEGRE